MVLTCVIPGRPIPKGRPRAVVRGGRIAVYTPPATRKAEAIVRDAVRRHLPEGWDVDVDGAWIVLCRFCLLPQHRADLDNLVKLVADALTGVVWANDDQIVALYLLRIDVPQPSDEGTWLRLVRRSTDDPPLDGLDWLAPHLPRESARARTLEE